MNFWSKDDLEKISKTDDLHIAPLREDGVTFGTPTWIWSVVVGDTLYVRAYSGTSSSWYKAAIRQQRGRIHAAGITKEVTFEAVMDKSRNEQIDNAYRARYKTSPYLEPMISERSRSATVKIIPETPCKSGN
jgi:hypothetical protein